ncbi:MAG: hypothetical protein IH853_14260 [Bacteroidetes bacterium]|nr:hypothetical protein [Bacteroidota bacterium]MCH8247925.1 hypothetical protein [Bacteroidota bacterium]
MLEIATFENQDKADLEYWLSRTPHERLIAVEQIRRVFYAYDSSAGRLQRVLEVVEQPRR